MIKLITVITAALLTIGGCAEKAENNGGIRLYALDCGTFNFADLSSFSREGVFDGQSGVLANPCFLIRHPKGDLLWDTGFEDTLADMPDGAGDSNINMKLKTRLADQLARLDLKPSDIDYLSMSHSHPDNVGNGNLFAGAIFIIQQLEHIFMFSDERKADKAGFALYSALENANTLLFENEHDVFGDGSVVMLFMPGHTPGHSVLLVRLENSGTILLTGDLYILAKGRELQTVAVFNTDAQATLDSMDKFEALAAKEGARVVIQHDKAHFDALPEFPAFLD